ncbi:unnamed protein product [Schistosoma intercalatum]|nr:unnamed protein product [Schistosoma intercalatum]
MHFTVLKYINIDLINKHSVIKISMSKITNDKSVTEYGCTKNADKLHQYICDHSLRLSEAQKWLLQETSKHPLSFMLISSIEMQLLANLCYAINARRTLDVGTYTGYSALSIAEVLPSDGRIVAVDKTDEYLKDYCLPAWKKAGVESKIDFRLGPALQTLQNLIDNGESGTFDFALIDADKENYSNYYELCLKLVRPRGIIAIDNLGSTWLENCPNSQLYRNGSVKFVESVREEMNKWIKESGKEKLLAVNSGDTGCGVGDNPDPMLMFRDVADLIISREFVWGRGEKERELTFNQTALQKYLTYTDSDKEILGLTTSTVHIPPYGDTLQLATTLLLPGLPVIYYGTEIDVNRVTLHYLPQSIYPKGKTYNDEPFDKYSSVLSHMPMPWDFNGKRFSATINDSRFRDYLIDYNDKKVVESELAEGNDKSVLRLVQKLVALRQNPSIKWGTMEQINIDQESVSHAEAFARKAKGFPTFIVVLVKYFKEDYFLDLTSVCSSITPRVIYPSHPQLSVDNALSTSKIFIPKLIYSSYILVFECN